MLPSPSSHLIASPKWGNYLQPISVELWAFSLRWRPDKNFVAMWTSWTHFWGFRVECNCSTAFNALACFVHFSGIWLRTCDNILLLPVTAYKACWILKALFYDSFEGNEKLNTMLTCHIFSYTQMFNKSTFCGGCSLFWHFKITLATFTHMYIFISYFCCWVEWFPQ